MKLKYHIGVFLTCATLFANVSAQESVPDLNKTCGMTQQDKNILQAIEHLDKAVYLALKSADNDIRESIGAQLKVCSSCIKTEFLSKNYEKAVEMATTLYENIDEIMADCPDMQLRDGISACMGKMMDALDSL